MSETSEKTARRRGRPAKKDRNAASEIRQAARLAFAEAGFKGTSIAEIAQRAGVAKPLVHYHFASKDELWRSSIGEGLDALKGELLAFQNELATSSDEDPVNLATGKLVQYAATHAHMIRIITDETSSGSQRGDWLIETYLKPLYELAIEIIATLSGDREVGSATPPEHLVPILFGAINFPFLDAAALDRTFDVDVSSKGYIDKHAEIIAKLLISALGRG